MPENGKFLNSLILFDIEYWLPGKLKGVGLKH